MKPGIVLDPEEDGAILFDPTTRKLMHLNETGAFLFGLLDGEHSVEALMDDLCSRYASIDRVAASSEVHQFLSLLIEADLAREG
jgi:hypothetical protein